MFQSSFAVSGFGSNFQITLWAVIKTFQLLKLVDNSSRNWQNKFKITLNITNSEVISMKRLIENQDVKSVTANRLKLFNSLISQVITLFANITTAIRIRLYALNNQVGVICPATAIFRAAINGFAGRNPGYQLIRSVSVAFHQGTIRNPESGKYADYLLSFTLFSLYTTIL